MVQFFAKNLVVKIANFIQSTFLHTNLYSFNDKKFMKENSTPFKNSRTSKIVFILSIIASGFWWLAKGINVYSDAIVGAMFELLWLPVLGMLFLLPIMSLVLLVKERVNLRSLYIYSILIGMATIFFMIFGK